MKAENSSRTAVQRLKVLAIDDDAFMRGLLKLHLEHAGYEVMLAEDGIEGGYLAMHAAPDLVLIDVQMPHMSGYELVLAMKADPATQHIPVVFLTSDDDVEERSDQIGAEACLKKPVRADRLLALVGDLTR
jgi:CheY-like chemotaxis protein